LARQKTILAVAETTTSQLTVEQETFGKDLTNTGKVDSRELGRGVV